MRGTDTKQGTMLTLLSPERVVPAKHQRRTSKVATDVIEGDVDDEQVEAGHERGQ